MGKLNDIGRFLWRRTQNKVGKNIYKGFIPGALKTSPIWGGIGLSAFSEHATKSSRGDFSRQYKNMIEQNPSLSGATPYYGYENPRLDFGIYGGLNKPAHILQIKREVNMNILKKIGLEKTASAKDPVELFFNGVVKLGYDASDGIGVLAEIDSNVAVDKLAADYEVEDVDALAMEIGEALSDGKIEKTAADKKIDKLALAKGVIEQLMPIGEVSKLAARVLIGFGESNEVSIDKIAAEIGVTEDDINTTAVAMELASEGYSPELLKSAADEAKIDFKKMATAIVSGEKFAVEKIVAGDIGSELVEKTASAEETADGFKYGMNSALEKLAFLIHPKGIAIQLPEKFTKVASEKGDKPDFEAHKLACEGAVALDFDPLAVQSVYSYMDKGYALDKHASVLEESYKEQANLAFGTLTKLAALSRAKKLDEEEDPAKAIEKMAVAFKEPVEKIAERMYLTTNFLAGKNPREFVGTGTKEELGKKAEAWLKDVLNVFEHDKVS